MLKAENIKWLRREHDRIIDTYKGSEAVQQLSRLFTRTLEQALQPETSFDKNDRLLEEWKAANPKSKGGYLDD